MEYKGLEGLSGGLVMIPGAKEPAPEKKEKKRA
jgi:hypothetical protein